MYLAHLGLRPVTRLDHLCRWLSPIPPLAKSLCQPLRLLCVCFCSGALYGFVYAMATESDFAVNSLMRFCTDTFLAVCIKIASLSGTFKVIPFPKNFRNAFTVHLNNGNTFQTYFLQVLWIPLVYFSVGFNVIVSFSIPPALSCCPSVSVKQDDN